MTMSVVVDKLAFVRRLESDDAFSRGEALSEALHQAVNETVATKADLARPGTRFGNCGCRWATRSASLERRWVTSYASCGQS